MCVYCREWLALTRLDYPFLEEALWSSQVSKTSGVFARHAQEQLCSHEVHEGLVPGEGEHDWLYSSSGVAGSLSAKLSRISRKWNDHVATLISDLVWCQAMAWRVNHQRCCWGPWKQAKGGVALSVMTEGNEQEISRSELPDLDQQRSVDGCWQQLQPVEEAFESQWGKADSDQ